MTTYATANFGRAESAAPVVASMDAVEHGLVAVGDVVLCAQEWDEGDRGYSDHQLGGKIFADWTIERFAEREPILLHTARKALSVKGHPAARGVPHQSPARTIQQVILEPERGGVETVVLNGHYPAGAHNGSRSPRVKVALLAGYVRMLAVHRRLIRHHHKAGRNVVWCMDTNWRNFPPMHRREVPVFHSGPDYIRAIPAKGRTVKAGPTKTIGMSIEPMHDCHYAEIHFPKEQP